MNELLPEVWGVEAPQLCCQGSRRPSRRGPVSDIMLWVECFSTLVAILASKYPQHIPDFMAYQKAIVRASRNFEGSSWVVYDRCYRHQAAATKNLVWSIPDSALYNKAFTGRAKAIPRCQHCLSENHTLSDCPDCPLDMQREHRHQQDRNLQIRGGFSSEYCHCTVTELSLCCFKFFTYLNSPILCLHLQAMYIPRTYCSWAATVLVAIWSLLSNYSHHCPQLPHHLTFRHGGQHCPATQIGSLHLTSFRA